MTSTLRAERLVEMGLPAPASIARLDRRARSTFAQVPQSGTFKPQRPGAKGASPEMVQVLRRSAEYLDLWRVLSGIAEAVELSDARSFSEVHAIIGEIVQRARLLSRIDVSTILFEDSAVKAAAQQPRTQPDPSADFPVIADAQFVRLVSSLVELCPIDELIVLSQQTGEPDLGHRCRLSYDWLQAFVRRRRAGEAETLHILGRAYAEGRLSLDETSHLIGFPRHDAVSWLEEYGYARDLNVIARSAEQKRKGKLARIREDRLRRGGVPQPDDSLIIRDVLATQRIEDVDARPWVQTDA